MYYQVSLEDDVIFHHLLLGSWKLNDLLSMLVQTLHGVT